MIVAALAAVAALALAAAWRELRAGGPTGGRGPRLPGLRLPASWSAGLGVSARLARSGLAHRLPLAAVLLAKGATAALAALVAAGVAPVAPGRLALLVALGLPAAGFMLPDALLEREARGRRRRLTADLPDVLDLLAVGSAAGRSPAASFRAVAESSRGPLATELRVVVAEIECGRSLEEALATLRERAPGAPIAALCAAIERSRRLGSPLAEQLRAQAAGLRAAARRGVEEHAARAAPKIQLVIALVLVPSVLLMIAAALLANAGTLLGDV